MAHDLQSQNLSMTTQTAFHVRLSGKPWILILGFVLLACNYPSTNTPTGENSQLAFAESGQEAPIDTPSIMASLAPTRAPGEPIASPTPDNPHLQPTLRAESAQYVVQAYDTLGQIAQRFGVTVQELTVANNLLDPNQLEIGQLLIIPPASPESMGPAFKILPDSELVNGPVAATFDIAAFVKAQEGYLPKHQEEVEGRFLSGTEIVARVAKEYSVNPKVLLALLEMQSGWLRNSNPRTNTLQFPLGYPDAWRSGLYRQLSWAADRLNEGYYGWKAGLTSGWRTSDGAFIPADPTINAGTAGVQNALAYLHPEDKWRNATSENGFFALYNELFGYPFDFAIEPLVPGDLAQPLMQLPFEKGVPWVFSGGPHSGWGSGSAWAALDFVARGEQIGCQQSGDWVVAVADGLIVRAENGAVVQDLDGDGYEQTGWTVLYMHVAENQRVAAGQFVRAGERIGHPSCEGGVANASHLHLARRYNGEWIPSFGTLPFVMDNWVSASSGTLYDGTMQRDGQAVEACECRDPRNMLQR